MAWFGGSRQTIEALVSAHYADLYRYGYRLSGSAQEAEDLTQETFCQAQRKLHQLRDAGCVKSWLFTILRNAYLHGLRSRKNGKQVSLESVCEIPDRAVDSMPIVDSGSLQQALQELPEVFRTPVILFYFDDFSYRDIAEAMGVPIGTVMSRLARAKAYLRQRLMDPADLVGKVHQEGS